MSRQKRIINLTIAQTLIVMGIRFIITAPEICQDGWSLAFPFWLFADENSEFFFPIFNDRPFRASRHVEDARSDDVIFDDCSALLILNEADIL